MISRLNQSIERLAGHLTVPLLTLCAFTLPISSTLKSFFFPWALINILWIPVNRQFLYQSLAKRYVQMSLILFGLVVIGLFYSPASIVERGIVLGKYSKLLYLPVFIIGFYDRKARNWAIHGFLLAMTLTCVLAISRQEGYLLTWLYDPDCIFRNHIITGFMISYAAFLVLQLAMLSHGYRRLVYLSLMVLFTYQMFFVSGGRMGYISFILLVSYGCYHFLPRRQSLLAMLMVLSVVSFSYFNSGYFHTRVNSTIQEYQDYHHSHPDSSVGYRFQFQNFAHQLWVKHPLVGNGTGSFTYYFRILNPIPTWLGGLLEPHNQYWLFAAEYGCLGVLLLLLYFISFYWESFQLIEMKVALRALLFAFMLGNLTDSLLFYSGPGYFFIFFMAICLGEQGPKKGGVIHGESILRR